MKKQLISIALCAGLISTFAMARGGHHNTSYHNGYHQQNNTYVGNVVNTTPIYDLSDQQKEDLNFMYQEEKLARDVYITLGNIWNSKVFLNIQKSEQQHMNAIKSLLDKYSLPTPVIEDQVGVFENDELQTLYNDLIAKGKTSLKDALEVGVLIEETDIADLEKRIVDAPDDMKAVFESLLNGSNNHLRAFNRTLENLNGANTNGGNYYHGNHRRGRF